MSPDELRWWFEDYLDACNRHDLDAIRDRLAPDVRRVGAPGGADAWLRDTAALLVAFPDYRWKRITVVTEGDRIAAHLRTRGTHRGDFGGVRPTGRHVGIAVFGFYRVDGGRIAEYAGSADDAALLAQLTS
ncbi:MAG: ester cyclase [Acidobacteria bacterium]|nr:ester cyclase [Acidobacteriota bacterium]